MKTVPNGTLSAPTSIERLRAVLSASLCTSISLYALFIGDPAAAAPRPSVIDNSFKPDLLGWNPWSIRTVAQEDGKLVVAVWSNSVPVVARLNEDGSKDISFSLDPLFTQWWPVGGNGNVEALAALPGGGVVAAEWATWSGPNGEYNYKNRLVRINADGSLDQTFNPAFIPGNAPVHIDYLYSLADGRVFVADNPGGCHNDAEGRWYLHNGGTVLTATGAQDPQFTRTPIINRECGRFIASVALAPDGKLLVAGQFVNPGVNLIRLKVDGTLDLSFKPQVPGGWDQVSAVAVQSDGRIVIALAASTSPDDSSPDKAVLARLLPDGQPDPSFIPAGETYHYSVINALAVRADDTIMIAPDLFFSGYSLKLKRDGGLDLNLTAVAGSLGSVSSAVLDPKDRVVGLLPSPEWNAPFLARFLTNGTIPGVEFAQARYNVREDAPAAMITLRRSGDITLPLSVRVATQDGTAGAGTDYVAKNEVLQFAAGEETHSFQIPILDDPIVEGDETVLLALSEPSPGAIISGHDSALLTIVDNELFIEQNQAGGPEFATDAITIVESEGTAKLVVQRLGDSSQAFTVKYSTSDVTAKAGIDYVAQSGTLQFAPLQVTNVIAIPILNNVLVDGDRSFQVHLHDPSGPAVLMSHDTAVVTIQNNDGGIEFASDTFTVNEAAGFAEVVVQRNGDGLGGAAVDYVLSDGTATAGADYLARHGTITFAPGETSKTFQVPIIDDGLVEWDATIRLALMNPRAGAMLGARTNVTLVIVDNEIPTVVDPTFDPGRGAIAYSGGSAYPGSIALQPDGKIVAGGNFSYWNGVSAIGVARLNADGTLDNGFHSPIPGFAVFGRVFLQPDGKVLCYYAPPGAAGSGKFVTRLNSNGTTDSIFHSTLFESVPQNYADTVQAFVLQPDGKMLVGGRFDRARGVAQTNLARLNADGTLDTSFEVSVVKSPSGIGYEKGEVQTVLVQPDGKILIAGDFTSVNGTSANGYARLDANGTLQPGFSLPDNPYYPYTSALLGVQSDGKILVQESEILRLNTDGSRDSSFSAPDAHVSTSYYRYGIDPRFAYLIALQTDGTILLFGSFVDNGISRSGLFRLHADGSLDRSLPLVDLRDANNNPVAPSAFAIQPDGNILIAGDFTTVNGIPRAGLVRVFGNFNGPPTISFAAVRPLASTDAGLAIVTLQRLGDTSHAASVHFSTQDGTALANWDYFPTSGLLEFAPLETEKTIIIPTFDDGVPGVDRTFSVLLSEPSAGAFIGGGGEDYRCDDRKQPTARQYRSQLQPGHREDRRHSSR